MGNSEDGKSSKSEKSSPPMTEQNGVHVYPDWAAMQAYYGPRVALPPYFNSAVAPGHPPPYMWGPPQPMMPPYGAPYAAIYAHGGVYAHPAVPMGSSAPSQGGGSSPAVSEALVGTPLSIDTPTKPPGNTDKGLIKKLKGFDGLAMSIGNPNVEKADGAENGLSQSTTETEGSSDGSDGNTEEADQKKRKRSRTGSPTTGEDEKTESKTSALSVADKVLGVPLAPAIGAGQPANFATTLELSNPEVHVKGNSDSVPTIAVISPEAWMQNERELKRERRKQSNRESARRSRLRKQAETEELARRVESLTAENVALKLELNKLVDNSQKLRNENATLMEKLKGLQSEQEEENNMTKLEIKRDPTDSTENLLSRVNNSGSVGRSSDEIHDAYEKKSSKSGTKLHQLLGTNPRADAVAAG